MWSYLEIMAERTATVTQFRPSPMGTMRYFQAWESCKEALHKNTESNWTDTCSES